MANVSAPARTLLLPVTKEQPLAPSKAFGSPKMRGTLSPQANMHARLPGCISPTLLSPMSRHSPISPKSPISPVSPGKRIRRNAAILGISLDLRSGQASLPLPVRSLLGDIIFPTDLQGISYVGDGMEQPTYTVSTVRRGAAVNTLAATAPFRKVVWGGA